MNREDAKDDYKIKILRFFVCWPFGVLGGLRVFAVK